MSGRRHFAFRLMREYFLSTKAAAASVVLVLAVAAADLAMPWLVKIAVDALIAARAPEVSRVFREVALLCLMILAMCLLQYAFRFVLSRLYNRVIYRGSARLRQELYGRLQRQPMNSLAERRIGEVLTNLVVDIQSLQDSCLDLISEIPFDICILLGLTVAMFILNPLAAAAVIAFLAGSIVAAFFMGQRGWHMQTKSMESHADLASRIQEGLTSARTVAIFNATADEGGRLEEISARHAEDLEQVGKIRAAVTPFLGLAEYVGIVIVLLVGGWSLLHGALTAGGLVAFLAYMEMSADPMMRSAHIVPGIQKAAAAAARLGILLDEMDVPPEKFGAVKPPEIRGEIKVSGLTFCYKSRSRPALSGIRFSVSGGERIAIVGPNGSGKSTLLDLLLRLQNPSSGEIRIDEWNLSDVSLSSWRSFVGVVPQDTRLLNRSVAENISLGKSFVGAVEAAAGLAGIDPWIRSLPLGYETVVGEGGAFLSGGERQRIAIARLFFRNPSVLVLDEPTAALDAQSEADILPTLERLCRGRTCFIVSHRTEVLRSADKVLLLKDGQQLAYDEPGRVWRDFPEFRSFFPAAWRNERTFSVPV